MRLLFYYGIFFFISFIAWNYYGLIYFVSLFIFLDILTKARSKSLINYFLKLAFLLLLLNLSATFWLYNVSFNEAISAILANTFIMIFPLLIPFFIFKKNNLFFKACTAIIFILFEVLYTQWDIAWPWIITGHVMGNMHYLIQWYSYFGVFSGSLWLFILAILLSDGLRKKRLFRYFFICLSLPICFSLYHYYADIEIDNESMKVTTYIPNGNENSNFLKTKKMFESVISDSIREYIVCPEIFLSDFNIYSQLQEKNYYYLDKIVDNFPQSKIIFGMEFRTKSGLFNAVAVKEKDEIFFKYKQKHVPFREYLNEFLSKLLSKKSFYQKCQNDNLSNIKEQYSISPLVCYESIFTFYTAKVSSKSKSIFLLTSEEFMNNSDFGSEQYINIVKIRAIENRRSILKCSYKGLSCIISPKGDIVRKLSTGLSNVDIALYDKDTPYQNLLKLF